MPRLCRKVSQDRFPTFVDIKEGAYAHPLARIMVMVWQTASEMWLDRASNTIAVPSTLVPVPWSTPEANPTTTLTFDNDTAIQFHEMLFILETLIPSLSSYFEILTTSRLARLYVMTTIVA